MTDLARVLEAVLHDVRSPLAAATGYLRLLREGRVAPGTESEHVIEQAQVSLKAIATLCTNAEAWRPTEGETRETVLRAQHLAGDLAASVAAHDVSVEDAAVSSEATVTVLGNWPELCLVLGHALAQLVHPRQSDAAGFVTITTDAGVLRVSATLPPLRGGIVRSTFDPWVYQGLTVAAGLHAVELAGGRWRFDESAQTVRVLFDLVLEQGTQPPDTR
ncbi:MAG: hypothetical protein ABMA15_01175 [Vicinamibacterales bacterium]